MNSSQNNYSSIPASSRLDNYQKSNKSTTNTYLKDIMSVGDFDMEDTIISMSSKI